MKLKRILAEITAFALFAFVLAETLVFLSRIYMPERTSFGSTWNMYLEEDKDSIDVMFFGSSMVYCDINPAVIYEDKEITSYVMSAPEMTIPQTYYYIKEALKTQSPDVIFVELSGMYFPDYSSHSHETVGYMPYSENRLGAVFETAEPEARLSLLFPLNKYHGRWQEDGILKKRADSKPDIYAGFTPTQGVNDPLEEKRVWRYDDTNVKFEKNCQYIEKIKEFCAENKTELVFFIVPACSNYTPEDVSRIREAAGEYTFFDFNDVFDEIGFDMKTDFYDPLHLNIVGAEKFSAYLASYIAENFELSEKTYDGELWQSRVDAILSKQ